MAATCGPPSQDSWSCAGHSRFVLLFVLGLGFRGFRAEGLEFRGLRFRVWGFGVLGWGWAKGRPDTLQEAGSIWLGLTALPLFFAVASPRLQVLEVLGGQTLNPKL